MRAQEAAFCFLLLGGLFLYADPGAPVERPKFLLVAELIEKFEAQRDADPKDPDEHYSVARVYYLAFASNVAGFEVGEAGPKVYIPGPRIDVRERNGKLPRFHPRAGRSIPLRIYYAERAVRSFEDAIELAPENALYWLGYASALEEIWSLVMRNYDDLFPQEFRKVKVPSLREAYGKAFALGKKLEGRPSKRIVGSENGLISYEAARGLIRLEKASDQKLTDAEKRELQEAKETVAWFEKLPIVDLSPTL